MAQKALFFLVRKRNARKPKVFGGAENAKHFRAKEKRLRKRKTKSCRQKRKGLVHLVERLPCMSFSFKKKSSIKRNDIEIYYGKQQVAGSIPAVGSTLEPAVPICAKIFQIFGYAGTLFRAPPFCKSSGTIIYSTSAIPRIMASSAIKTPTITNWRIHARNAPIQPVPNASL